MLKQVKTKNGWVQGLSGNNARISVFKGIPFAAPPIEKNRWRAPQPPDNWDGILEAYKFAPISVQDTPGLSDDIYCREWHVDPEIDMNEDCLYLNIWTPAKAANDKLPVLVWFFGGAFQWGYTPEMEFNGENIAKRGVIVVSVNYRLGALGFLTHPEISKEAPDAPANFGLLDQQAGLKWVRDNISAFGGNPDNVTIAGQSAGGASVFSHMGSDSSRGLFHKAVIFSGIFKNPLGDDELMTPKLLKDAEKLGETFFEYLGVNTLEEARALNACYIRDKYAAYREKYPFFSIVIDNAFLEDEPYNLALQGKSKDIPLLTGNTSDEFIVFVREEKDGTEDTDIEVASSVIEGGAKTVLNSRSVNGYYYRFEADIPGSDNPGTFHSVDLWFFFETLSACHRPFDGHHYDLADQMCSYFTNFVKSGNPNGLDFKGNKLPTWNLYSNASPFEMKFTPDGALGSLSVNSPATNRLAGQAVNPYLPSWEYIPDGEPYVFGDRVYVYGSHDYFNGHAFCLGDYVCWSAPVNDLGNWKYEGVIYERIADPLNTKNNMCLYAPDVTQGPDGRYYLYYVLDRVSVVSVAVCDTPAGKYEFLGYVHYEDGALLGQKAGDEPQFDPGVMTVGKDVYLYTGFCGQGDATRHGAMMTVLCEDMLTIKQAPKIIIPGSMYSKGTGFEGHAFFEAPSIRERNGKYYLIYSSEVMHELCYATSDRIDGEYKYGGVIISNSDIGIDSYKPVDMPTAYGANNHGSMVEINGKWYIFYHRHTHNTWYSRQGCAEKIEFTEDGHIIQAEMTSCGLNGSPLRDDIEYPAYIVCNMFTDIPHTYVGESHVPMVTQEGKDNDKNEGYITNIAASATLGFKYFDFNGVKEIELTLRGYANGRLLIKASIDGDVLAEIPLEHSTVWEKYRVPCLLPDGVHPLYISYTGQGSVSLKAFRFIH